MTTTLALPRDEAVDQVASVLLPQVSLLTRLLVKQAHLTVSRTEGGMLRALSAAPQRITTLAELEGLAQPTVTLLVKRLEERGWVTRARDPEDGRVVLVSITAAGRETLEDFRAHYQALLRARLAELPDEHIGALVQATRALPALIEALQQEASA